MWLARQPAWFSPDDFSLPFWALVFLCETKGLVPKPVQVPSTLKTLGHKGPWQRATGSLGSTTWAAAACFSGAWAPPVMGRKEPGPAAPTTARATEAQSYPRPTSSAGQRPWGEDPPSSPARPMSRWDRWRLTVQTGLPGRILSLQPRERKGP